MSVIVPALNEEQNLKGAVDSIIASLRAHGTDWEIILIDDGSSDLTREIALGLSNNNPRIKFLHHSRPMGVGYSFRDGVSHATKDAVTFIPGDGENDPDEIIKYVPLLEYVDLVVPFIVNKEVRSWMRQFLSGLFVSIINFSFRTKFNCTNGNVIYKRNIIEPIKQRSAGFFFQTECLIKAAKSGFIFAEVPMRIRTRAKGESKAMSLRSLKAVVSEYLRLLAYIYFSRKG